MSDKKVYTTKTCEIMQYFKYLSDDLQTAQAVYDKLLTLTNLTKCSIIEHDKDSDENGNLKDRHFHAVLTFNTGKTFDSIAKVLNIESQYVQKIKSTTASAEEYLIHENDSDKYHYEPSEVISTFDYVRYIEKKRQKKSKSIRLDDIAEKISNGEIKEYNLYSFITVNEYAKHKSFFKNCFEYRQRSLECSTRDLQCMFITGESGCGKTTYAKEFAKRKGYNVYISSSGSNPFDDYKGQECIILDDIRSGTFSLSDLLKITDTHTLSNVACRFYNKSLFECKLIIVTSIISIYDFYSAIQKEKEETHIQLYRRFPLMVDVHKNDIDIFTYSLTNFKYEKQCTIPNLVPKKYKNDNCNLACEFVETFGLKECDISVQFE